MLRVLTYHRIAEPDATPLLHPGLVSATPAAFEQQMTFLARNYDVVSLFDVLAAARGEHRLSARAVLLTFDDAYRDFAQIAWPALKRFPLPATLFVPTAFPDRPEQIFWWDRLHQAVAYSSQGFVECAALGLVALHTPSERARGLRTIQHWLKTLPHDEAMRALDQICDQLNWRSSGPVSVLSWAELRTLAEDGVTLGVHSRTHPLLTRIGCDQARAEIAESWRDLQREAGLAALPAFCYPGGAFNDAVVGMVQQQGFQLAFTTDAGANDPARWDPLRLKRANITPRTSPALFRLRLSRLGARVDQWRHRLRGKS